MRRLKFALVLILAFLLLVVVLQNTDTTQLQLLSVQVELPRAVLMVVCVASGFLIGYVLSMLHGRKKVKPSKPEKAAKRPKPAA